MKTAHKNVLLLEMAVDLHNTAAIFALVIVISNIY